LHIVAMDISISYRKTKLSRKKLANSPTELQTLSEM